MLLSTWRQQVFIQSRIADRVIKDEDRNEDKGLVTVAVVVVKWGRV